MPFVHLSAFLMPRSRAVVAVLCCVLVLPVAAEVYRSVDEDGNVIFSDVPAVGAEEVELNETTVVPAYKPSARERWKPREPEGAAGLYESITITAPAHEETVRNVEAISVAVAVSPALRAKQGDRVQLYLDGEAYGGAGKSTTWTLTGIERGAHDLAAAIIDGSGEELLRSPTSVFFVHRTSIQHPPPAGAR